MAVNEYGVSQGLKSRGGYDVRVRLEGDWVKFSLLVKNMDLLLAASAIAGQKDFAENYKKAVQENIRNGGRRFGYPPNTTKTLGIKKKYGGSITVLNWLGTMANSVKVMPNSSNTGFSVGIPKNLSRPTYFDKDDNNLSISEYANVLEHGSFWKSIPERPTFSDTFKETMGGKRGIIKYIEKAIIKAGFVMGIKIKKGLR